MPPPEVPDRARTVCHLVTSLDFGGVETHMEVIARTQLQTVFQHCFVALGNGGATERALREMGAEVLCLRKRPTIPSFSAFVTLVRFLIRKRPDVLHCHGAEANFHGLLAAWIVRVPVRIGEEIGIPDHGRTAQLVFRHVYRLAHLVIGVSDAVVTWLAESNEVPVDKLIRINNPVALRIPYQDMGKPARDPFRICYVGRLEPVKNPIALLEAFAVVNAKLPSAQLWFVGEGTERITLEARTAEMGLECNVEMLGFQPDPVSFIRRCHVYVQPSLSEGFSLALVEAMRCGVPPIATAVGGAPDIIQHGKTGWLLHETSPYAIARALEEAAALGSEALAEMGGRARESVKGRFGPGQYLRTLEHLYDRLLSGNAPFFSRE